MIGAVIFVISFLAFLVITIGIPTLPIGEMLTQDLLKIPKVDNLVLGIPGWILINALINGVVYGFIIWLVFSLISKATGIGKKKQSQVVKQTVNVQVPDKEKKNKAKKKGANAKAAT